MGVVSPTATRFKAGVASLLDLYIRQWHFCGVELSPASFRMFRTVRFSTSHRRAVERTEWLQNPLDFFLGQPSVSAKLLLLRLCEALAALLALVPLNLRPTVETGLHHLYPAVVARHG